ncbi:XRE family transcriptional regulator [Thermodesulfobacteriota bacterium]
MKRNQEKIRDWMYWQRITVMEIARELDINFTRVSNTLASRRNDRKVLQYFIDKGCPAEILGLPEDMREAA